MGFSLKKLIGKALDPVGDLLGLNQQADVGGSSQAAFNREQERLKEKVKAEKIAARRATQEGKGLSRSAVFSFGNEDIADTYAERGEFGQKSFRFANNLNEGVFADKYIDNVNHPGYQTNQEAIAAEKVGVTKNIFSESLDRLRKSREDKTDTGLFL